MNAIEDRIEELEFMSKKHHTIILIFIILIILCLSYCAYLRNKKDMPLIIVACTFWFMAGLYPGEADGNNIRFLLCMTPLVFTMYWLYIRPRDESILDTTTSTSKTTKTYTVPYTLIINRCENCRKATIKKQKNDDNKKNTIGSSEEHYKYKEIDEKKDENKNIDDENVNEVKNDNDDIDHKTEIVDSVEDEQKISIVKLF